MTGKRTREKCSFLKVGDLVSAAGKPKQNVSSASE